MKIELRTNISLYRGEGAVRCARPSEDDGRHLSQTSVQKIYSISIGHGIWYGAAGTSLGKRGQMLRRRRVLSDQRSTVQLTGTVYVMRDFSPKGWVPLAEFPGTQIKP